jgi:hypothetical protein
VPKPKPFVFKAMPLIQVNPLDSNEALKMQKKLSCSSDDESEVPIIKSLFDIPGNSKFKNPKRKKNESSESSSEEEEK